MPLSPVCLSPVLHSLIPLIRGQALMASVIPRSHPATLAESALPFRDDGLQACGFCTLDRVKITQVGLVEASCVIDPQVSVMAC